MDVHRSWPIVAASRRLRRTAPVSEGAAARVYRRIRPNEHSRQGGCVLRDGLGVAETIIQAHV